MRILFVADGRSPIARSWISGIIEIGHQVHLATTYRCDPIEGSLSRTLAPVAFSRMSRGRAGGGRGAGVGLRARARQWLGPLTVPLRAGHLRAVIDRVDPDLVHALRIPFEGMLAAWANAPRPLVISSWGNDFTLHGPSSPLMDLLTRRTMAVAAGLHADCRRDLRLAADWGFPQDRPSVVLPGNGGLAPVFFEAVGKERDETAGLERLLGSIPNERPVVVNPRGFRSYVRNDTFFRSIPALLEQHPDAVIFCPAMAGDRLAERWIDRLSLGRSVRLLARLEPRQMAALLRRAQVVVSPSEHDGTPNSLLEAMACGAVPVAGDLESIREWIGNGENGYLVDPSDPRALAEAIAAALSDDAWRQQVAEKNRQLVRARAHRATVMTAAQDLYQRVLQASADGGPGHAML